MYLIPFMTLFPEQGEAETRTITTLDHPKLPDDEYALVEAYCPDLACDCRRVMLNVFGRRQSARNYLASISFGFDRDEELAGPYLDRLNPRSEYADVFLDIVARILDTDSRYVARLESHYHQVKEAVADPTHPVQQVLARARAESGERPPGRRRRRPKRRKKRHRR